MAKRKHQNLEIERQLKHRRKIYQAVAFVVAAVIIMAVSASLWAYRDRQTVLRYDGGRVATTDFRAVWHLEWQNNPAAREAALGSVKSIVALRDRAIYHNVDFTPEERSEAVQSMADWRQFEINNNGFDVMGYISNERLAELFNVGPLHERLLDIYVPHYDVDLEELAELVEEHIEENYHYGMDLQVQILQLSSREEAEEAESLLGTMDFDDLVRQFTEWLEDDMDMPPTASLVSLVPDLEGLAISPEDLEYLFNMEEGEYSHIVELMDFEFGIPVYVIFKMESISEADTDAVTEEMKEALIRVRREEIFVALVQDWVEEANFTINQRGYNSI